MPLERHVFDRDWLLKLELEKRKAKRAAKKQTKAELQKAVVMDKALRVTRHRGAVLQFELERFFAANARERAARRAIHLTREYSHFEPSKIVVEVERVGDLLQIWENGQATLKTVAVILKDACVVAKGRVRGVIQGIGLDAMKKAVAEYGLKEIKSLDFHNTSWLAIDPNKQWICA